MDELNYGIKKLFLGDICEQLVSSHFLSKFCHVYMPVTRHGRVDLIVEEEDGNLLKIQVKKAKLRYKSSHNKSRSLTCVTNYNLKQKNCDYDFLVIIHDDDIWKIPSYEITKTDITLSNDDPDTKIVYKWGKYKEKLCLKMI